MKFVDCDQKAKKNITKKNLKTLMWFSGSEFYHPLNVSDANRTMESIQDDELKFLIHGYTDRVQFNRTGEKKKNKCYFSC